MKWKNYKLNIKWGLCVKKRNLLCTSQFCSANYILLCTSNSIKFNADRSSVSFFLSMSALFVVHIKQFMLLLNWLNISCLYISRTANKCIIIDNAAMHVYTVKITHTYTHTCYTYTVHINTIPKTMLSKQASLLHKQSLSSCVGVFIKV